MKRTILKHPITISVGAVIGILIGLNTKPLSALFGMNSEQFIRAVSLPGDLFLLFLQMAVIPIIISAIAFSLGKLMRDKSSPGLIRRMILVFIVCMAICAGTGMILGIIGQPGSNLGNSTDAFFRYDHMNEGLEVTLGSYEAVDTARRLGFSGIIPIVLFSVIMGVAIGFLQEESALLLINFFSSVFYAFQKLVNWSLYLLPFGIISLLAGQIALVGIQIFAATTKFIVLCGIGTVIIFIICTFIIWLRSGIFNPFKMISVLFEPILLSFATQTPTAVLPSAINSLDNKMKFNSRDVNLTLPLGITLGRFGNIFYFAIAVFFTAQIYGVTLMPIHYLIIFVGVIIAGTAATGVSGIVTLSMLSIVLKPLNLPLEAVLVIFIAIDPIINPFRSFLIVYVNMAATTLIARQDENAGRVVAEEKQLVVFIQEIQNKPPLLNRVNGIPCGVEMSFIREIGKRWNRQVVYKDGATMNPHEREWMRERADIIAGIINKDDVPVPPAGYYFSNSWASVNINGAKKQLYFLLPEGKKDAKDIDIIIQGLVDENYIKFILAATKGQISQES